MDDLVEVQVVHASGDAHGPVHQQGRGDLAAGPQHLVELALSTVLHDDAVAWSLSADAPKEGRRERAVGGQILDTLSSCKCFYCKYRIICYIQNPRRQFRTSRLRDLTFNY